MPGQVPCTGPERPFLTSPLAAPRWKAAWASVAWGDVSPGAFWLPLGPPPLPTGSPCWGSRAIGLRLGRGVCVRSYFYLRVFRKFFITAGAGSVPGDGAGGGGGVETRLELVWLLLVQFSQSWAAGELGARGIWQG